MSCSNSLSKWSNQVFTIFSVSVSIEGGSNGVNYTINMHSNVCLANISNCNTTRWHFQNLAVSEHKCEEVNKMPNVL